MGMVPCLHQGNIHTKRKQIPYLPVRGHKLPLFIGGIIGSRKEICEVSGLSIPMVPRFNQSNGYIKMKLWTWRVQKFISEVGVDSVLTRVGLQTIPCHGGNIGSRKEICENSGLQIPMAPHLHQSNGYMKRKLRAWRVQKCIALVGADTVLTSAWLQTTLFHGG